MNKKIAVIISLLACLVLLVAIPATSMYAARARGDVNQDNEIDMKDVLMLRKKIANLPIDMEAYNPKAADANVDGEIDMKDVLVIRKFIARMIPELGPGVK